MESSDLVRAVWGFDPIVGARALQALVARGDAGEELVVSRRIEYPQTAQALRRVLRYVATRRETIVPRLLARLDEQGRYRDAWACGLLLAGADERAAGNELFAQLERGHDDGAADARYYAWGMAGGTAWTLWRFVERDRFLWEKLGTFAFRGACGGIARLREDDLAVLAELITHEWRGGKLAEIAASPDERISHEAIAGNELWSEANRAFVLWRRGALADAILREWAGHTHWRVRHFGAQILASLGFRRTVRLVAEWLGREPVERVRGSLLHALERTETSAGADAALDFYAASGEGGEYVARCGWRGSDAARARKVLGTLAREQGTASDEALVSLARMGMRDPGLLAATESDDHYRRVNAALALAYLGDTGEIDRIAAMRHEAAAPLERIYLAAALALLRQAEAVHELHQELVKAAAAEYPKQVDLFFVHRFLQTAVLEALAGGGAATAEAHAAWRAELEPLDPVAQPVVPASDAKPPTAVRAPGAGAAAAGAARPGGEAVGLSPRLAPSPAPKKKERRRPTDVLLVTVNPNETQALLEAFAQAAGQPARPVAIGDRVYRDLGSVNGTACMHALSEMGTAGPGAAHETVEKGIRALRPAAVIFVGIAFGIDEKKQDIGDILLAKQLRLYDLQRVGAQIVLRGDRPHCSTWLINYFNGFAQSSWSGAPVRTGLMLTGDKLVDDVDYRQVLRDLEPEAIGGEMEGAGLYVASHDMKVDWIVLKAICDWADGHKSKNMKSRQRKAARNAASFLIEALQSVPLRRGPVSAR